MYGNTRWGAFTYDSHSIKMKKFRTWNVGNFVVVALFGKTKNKILFMIVVLWRNIWTDLLLSYYFVLVEKYLRYWWWRKSWCSERHQHTLSENIVHVYYVNAVFRMLSLCILRVNYFRLRCVNTYITSETVNLVINDFFLCYLQTRLIYSQIWIQYWWSLY